jgi:hypothetical protein
MSASQPSAPAPHSVSLRRLGGARATWLPPLTILLLVVLVMASARSPSPRHRRPDEGPLRQQDLPQSGLTQPVEGRLPVDPAIGPEE